MPYRKISLRLLLVRHFISDAPDYDAGMIPVPQKHCPQVFLMALLEPLRISSAFMRIAAKFFSLENLPLIKCLIHHEKTFSVTQFKERRVRRIMRHTNGIDTHFLQFTQPPFPYFRRHRRPNTAAVMMYADAVQFAFFSVQ